MDSDNAPGLLSGESLEESRLNRRQLLKRSVVLGFSVPAVAALLAACGDDDDDEPEPTEEPGTDTGDDPTAEPGGDEEPTEATGGDEDPTEETDEEEPGDQPAGEGQYGGALQVALVDELSTLDPHQTTAAIIGFVVWQALEHLYTYDDEFNIIPELATGQETSEDGLSYTIPLREGVTFHNGKEMTATDVIASMERWGQLAGRGQQLFEDIDEIIEVDPYTIQVNLSSPNGMFWGLLSRHNNGCAIYPSELIEEVGLEPISQIVGTGPFEFVEHQPDNFIHFRRYEDYQPYSDAPNGWGGQKIAYVDEIFFRPVPDEAARAAGLQAGDYHVLQSTSPDNFDMLSNAPGVVAEWHAPQTLLTIQLNTQEGPMANPTLRQAILAAVEVEPMLLAAYGADAYRADPSWMPEELGVWYTDACGEFYNQNNPDRAAELMAEAGYNGEPLRFITSEHENFHINTALTAQQQLNAAGFNVEIEVYDWPTLSGEVRQDMSRWELLTSGTSIRPDPSILSPMDPSWGARWDSDKKRELLDQLMAETDQEVRSDLWEQIQCLGYEEDVPFIPLGMPLELVVFSEKLKGFRPELGIVNPFFWNVWIEE